MKKTIRAAHFTRRAVPATLLAALIGGATPAAAHEQHHTNHAAPAATEAQWEEAAIEVPDVAVLDQDGEAKHFFSDLVKGRTVAINFMYTSCSAICSPMTATLQKVQRELEARGGPRVEVVSISLDPETDTPAVLKEYAQRFGAGPNWHFVTAKPAELDRLLSAFGLAGRKKEEHTPLVFVSNQPTGKWTRAFGLAPATSIADTIAEAAGANAVAERPAGSHGDGAPHAAAHDHS